MIVKCANGHFYDTNKSKECPYCIKKERERSERISELGNLPSFDVSFGPVNEGVTVAMTPGETGEVEIGCYGQNHLQGMRAPGDSVTVGIYSKSAGTSYITGWLVCVDGPEKGRDYRIYHGKNWVGKSPDMDITIHGDQMIQSEKHCAIVYDGKGNKFYLTEGNGSLTYLNGSLLNGSVELKLGDEITIGNCKFEFVPFCREGHVWNAEEKA